MSSSLPRGESGIFRLASRLDDVGFSDLVKIRNRIMELKTEGAIVYQFEGGEPFLNTPIHIKDAMQRALRENKTRYAASSGIAELRAAIVLKVQTRNKVPAKIEDVIVATGGMQALFGAFQSVLNPGDEVLMFSPYWTPIRDLVGYAQARPALVPVIEARERGLLSTLEKYATPRARAIYYNSPQNPAGTVFSRQEAETIAGFARDRNLVVVADEAYEDLIYDGEHISIASLPGMFERTITCFTLSKSYSMTGWRIGYAVAPEPWMTGLRKTVLYTTNGVSTPTQWAALAAIETPPAVFEEIRGRYRERRDLLVNGLNDVGLRCDLPAGAFYAFPDASRIHADSRVAADILLEKARVSTVPGIIFGPHGEGHLRFSFSTAPEVIEAALASLRRNL